MQCKPCGKYNKRSHCKKNTEKSYKNGVLPRQNTSKPFNAKWGRGGLNSVLISRYSLICTPCCCMWLLSFNNSMLVLFMCTFVLLFCKYVLWHSKSYEILLLSQYIVLVRFKYFVYSPALFCSLFLLWKLIVFLWRTISLFHFWNRNVHECSLVSTCSFVCIHF